MNEITKPREVMPATPDPVKAFITEFESLAMTLPQIELDTRCNLHAGIYSRTVRIPAGVVITGANIRVPTVLTVVGTMRLIVGGKVCQIEGLTVFEAQANRKALMHAISDCYVTMAYATKARTLEQAEDEFTDEPEKLATRRKS